MDSMQTNCCFWQHHWEQLAHWEQPAW